MNLCLAPVSCRRHEILACLSYLLMCWFHLFVIAPSAYVTKEETKSFYIFYLFFYYFDVSFVLFSHNR